MNTFLNDMREILFMLIINQFNVTRECFRVFSMPPMQYDFQNWTRGKLYIPPCTFLQNKNKNMEVVVVNEHINLV